MPANYESIFDSARFITKKDLCELLNLDATRPNLMFTREEINKAYKVRALRFHPDKQSLYPDPISPAMCGILISDLALARDHMLKGEDNILGRGVININQSLHNNDWIGVAKTTLQSVKSNTVVIKQNIEQFHTISNSFLLFTLLSTFSEGQLNFRAVNIDPKILTAIQWVVAKIDVAFVATALQEIKKVISKNPILKLDHLVEIKKIFPEVSDEKWGQLIEIINQTREDIIALLSDELINKVDDIVKFWLPFLATVPSWKHIITVYFMSLLFTATSLVKYFNVLKVMTEVILAQKGILAFVVAALPLYVISLLLLPLNMTIHLGLQLSIILFSALSQVIKNTLNICYALFNLVLLTPLYTKKSFAEQTFLLVESGFNLTFRLSGYLILQVLDTLIFYLTDTSQLSSLLVGMDTFFDKMLAFIRPKSVIVQQEEIKSRAHNPLKESTLVVLPSQREQLNHKPQPGKTYGLFADKTIFNKEDGFLKKIIGDTGNLSRETPRQAAI